MFIALQVRHVTLLNGSSADLHLCVSAVMTHTHTLSHSHRDTHRKALSCHKEAPHINNINK